MSNNSKAFHRRKAVLFTNKPPSDQNHLSNFFLSTENHRDHKNDEKLMANWGDYDGRNWTWPKTETTTSQSDMHRFNIERLLPGYLYSAPWFMFPRMFQQ